MNRDELSELIRNGENSILEFKRDGVHPDSLAKALSAMLNLEGGKVLLGVEDDGSVSGLERRREEVERWVMEIARRNLQPAVIPSWVAMTLEDGRVVGVVGLPEDAPGKPYKAPAGECLDHLCAGRRHLAGGKP